MLEKKKSKDSQRNLCWNMQKQTPTPEAGKSAVKMEHCNELNSSEDKRSPVQLLVFRKLVFYIEISNHILNTQQTYNSIPCTPRP